MGRKKYCIQNKYNRRVVYRGTYEGCVAYANSQDKAFRKVNKILVEEEAKSDSVNNQNK